MELQNIGGYPSINAFVEGKIQKLEQTEHSFRGIYPLFFSESENVLYERGRGYRIEKITYGECREKIEKKSIMLRKLLSDAEVSKGSVIAVYLENSVEWIEMFWSVLHAGYNPFFLNMRLDDETLSEAMRSAGAKAVISNEKEFELPTILLSDIIPAEGASAVAAAAASDSFGDTIYVMSSGTSEHVKICAYTGEEFYHIIRNAREVVRDCALMKKHYEGELKQLCFLPFYHIFGLVAVYTWFAFFSRTFVELRDMAPDTIVNTIRRHKVTHIFAVPLFWEKVYSQAISTIRKRGDKTFEKFERGLSICDKLEKMPKLSRAFSKKAFAEVRENLFGESISFLISGGGAIREEVLRFFNGIGYHLSNGYGMTEIGITSVEQTDAPAVLNSGSVGKTFSSVRYQINEDGELLISGNSLARFVIVDGQRIDRPEWFNSHDLAEEKNGNFYILGRKDDLLIGPSGENLNPNLLEPKLQVTGVRELCLLKTEENGQVQPALLLSVNRFSTKEKLQAIREQVLSKLQELKLQSEIRKIYFTGDELLQGSEFKLNRIRLSRELQSGVIPLLDPDTVHEEKLPEDPLLLRIRGIFAAVLQKDESEIPYTADFFADLSGTSLDYFAMVSELQNEFGVSFPANGEQSLNTLRGIYEFIKAGM
ncbi:MAG: AMP-binding protein [Lachnospiraceae bacterium]|nr:AMP-binding protein [Lachnospiraceae bacterium]